MSGATRATRGTRPRAPAMPAEPMPPSESSSSAGTLSTSTSTSSISTIATFSSSESSVSVSPASTSSSVASFTDFPPELRIEVAQYLVESGSLQTLLGLSQTRREIQQSLFEQAHFTKLWKASHDGPWEDFANSEVAEAVRHFIYSAEPNEALHLATSRTDFFASQHATLVSFVFPSSPVGRMRNGHGNLVVLEAFHPEGFEKTMDTLRFLKWQQHGRGHRSGGSGRPKLVVETRQAEVPEDMDEAASNFPTVGYALDEVTMHAEIAGSAFPVGFVAQMGGALAFEEYTGVLKLKQYASWSDKGMVIKLISGMAKIHARAFLTQMLIELDTDLDIAFPSLTDGVTMLEDIKDHYLPAMRELEILNPISLRIVLDNDGQNALLWMSLSVAPGDTHVAVKVAHRDRGQDDGKCTKHNAEWKL